VTSLASPLGASVMNDPTCPSFSDLGVPASIVSVLSARGITDPTPIQTATIPDALDGRDITGRAPTGSGKTIAFAVPMAARVEPGRPGHPRALVLVPTRELATQIAEQLAPLLASRKKSLATFFGGVGFGPQIKALRRGIEVAVACPGRLEDLIRSGHIRLNEVSIVVVDEADRMADMGFLPALRRILDATSIRRQTLLFSATQDGAVDSIIRQYQSSPLRHELAATTEDLSRMSHRFQDVEPEQRLTTCAEIVADSASSMIFVRTRHGADRLTKQLGRFGIEAAAIHGARTQVQRQRALDSFRAGKVTTLVATDVAARGIHIDDLACVIHFDLPADATDYVHRSGRTARAGATGRVVSLVSRDQHRAVHHIVRTLDLDAELVGIPPIKAGGERSSRPARPRPSARRGASSRGARPRS
jgi:superfamily II DNA/RNA helicase